jgi:hypothetical protein
MNSQQKDLLDYLEFCRRPPQYWSSDELYYAPQVQPEVLLTDLVKPGRQRWNRAGALPYSLSSLQGLAAGQVTGRRPVLKDSRL